MDANKLAIVTGGSRGIGAAISARLAQDGVAVAIVYAGNTAAAAETVANITAAGGTARAFQCNVVDSEAVKAVCQEITDTMGPVSILVNDAGITRDGLIATMKEADFDAVIATNLKGAYNMIKALYRTFLRSKTGGRIINISSVVGVQGNAGQANYAASKAGLLGLTKSVARELAPRAVTCNAIAPGFIETEMTGALDDKTREAYDAMIPLRRMGSAQDVAEAVAFLASDAAAYITGQTLCVDGGICMI